MKINFIYFKCFCIKNKIKKIFNSAVSHLNFGGFSVNLKLCSLSEIRELNNKFRNIDKETDVLSFPNLNFVDKKIDTKTLSEELDQDTGLVSLGDIVICKEIAKRQAKEYGHSYKREICFLALHGLLHLIGYDHEIKEQEEEMMAKAESILKEHKVIR